MRRSITILVTLSLAGCASPESTAMLPDLPAGVEAISLLGDTLRSPPLAESVTENRLEQLRLAQTNYEASPDDADALIWYGRRLGYVGRYREAIEVFSEGIAKHPADARMYRHRGHRFITVRMLGAAEEDFERAVELIDGQPDEVEPDGLPNARNLPRSTLQSNIWYHLALARVLRGDLPGARQASEAGLEVSANDDMLVAMSYWYYMTLAQLDMDDDAAAVLDRIDTDMDIIENASYQRLLLLFKGVLPVDSVLDVSSEADTPLANATVGYGVGQWHAMHERDSEALEVWNRTLRSEQWAAFGYIAAEAELARRMEES